VEVAAAGAERAVGFAEVFAAFVEAAKFLSYVSMVSVEEYRVMYS
jgi:hypothetical protein